VIAGPDEDSQSVVSVLHDVRETGRDPTVDEVRSALRSLVDKGVVETVKKTVPTFRLAVERDQLRRGDAGGLNRPVRRLIGKQRFSASED